MEGPQSQDETARNETAVDEVAVLAGLFQTIGGIAVIATFAFVLWSVAVMFQWGESVYGGGNAALVVLSLFPGLIVLYFVLVLPVKLDQVREALIRGAGVIVMVYPFMLVRYTVFWFMIVPLLLEIDTPLWPVYSIVGILLLAEPRMRRVSLLRGLPHSVLDGLVICLGLLTAALTLFLILEGVASGTLYTITVLTASLVVVLFTLTYAIHTGGSGIKRVQLL